jgi:hypothetical protein
MKNFPPSSRNNMCFSMVNSKSLAPSCKAGDVWLHSPYDPEREARRFVASSIGSSRPSHVLLLGPCLDYLTPAVRSILPGSRIVSIQYASFFAARARSVPDACWHPGITDSLGSFLDANIDENAISGVAVLEWEPASRAFPEESLFARKAVSASLDRLNSSAATVKAFGKRWLSNACLSFLLVDRAVSPRPRRIPILLAAAGPSLNSALASVSRFKGRFMTIAVSSALSACRHSGIEPDLVVSTDGGFWSRHHLYPLAGKSAVLASPITALPSASLYGGISLMLIDQGSFVESELLPRLGPGLALPSHGTVSGTALYLASRISDGPIIAAGLDLASFGDLAHARPHGFDAVLEARTGRLSPLEGVLSSRGDESSSEPLSIPPWLSSRAMNAYASALSLDSRFLSGRLFRLFPSPQTLSGFEPISEESLEDLLPFASPSDEDPFIELELAPIPERPAILSDRISAWRDAARGAARDMGDGRMPESELVAELLRSIDIVDYAAARRAALARENPAPAAADLASRCDSFLAKLERRFSA